MERTFLGFLSPEDWHAYMYAIFRSRKLRERRQRYEKLLTTVRAGEVLVADCKLSGTKQRQIVAIKDFIDFDRAIEKLEDARDPVIKIDFRSGSESTLRLAS